MFFQTAFIVYAIYLRSEADDRQFCFGLRRFKIYAGIGRRAGPLFDIRRQANRTKNHIDIPRGERFGGQHTDNLPCTLNGFIACRSDEILPEYKIPYKQERYPEHGSTISVIENGIKREMLMFDEEKLQFVPYKNKE